MGFATLNPSYALTSAQYIFAKTMDPRVKPGGDARAQASLRPVGDRLGADDHGPFVGAALLHAVAVLLRTLPGRAEAVLGELPGAFALGAGLAERFTRHRTFGREHHLELDVRGRRGRERLAVKEHRLDVLWGEPPGGRRHKNSAADEKSGRAAHNPSPHR